MWHEGCWENLGNALAWPLWRCENQGCRSGYGLSRMMPDSTHWDLEMSWISAIPKVSASVDSSPTLWLLYVQTIFGSVQSCRGSWIWCEERDCGFDDSAVLIHRYGNLSLSNSIFSHLHHFPVAQIHRHAIFSAMNAPHLWRRKLHIKPISYLLLLSRFHTSYLLLPFPFPLLLSISFLASLLHLWYKWPLSWQWVLCSPHSVWHWWYSWHRSQGSLPLRFSAFSANIRGVHSLDFDLCCRSCTYLKKTSRHILNKEACSVVSCLLAEALRMEFRVRSLC